MSVAHSGGASELSVIAILLGSPETSSGFRSLRPCCCQFSLRFHDVLVLPVPALPSLELECEVPLDVPPLVTTIVCSPRRSLTYSAVCRSLTPKKTCVVLESRVWP